MAEKEHPSYCVEEEHEEKEGSDVTELGEC